MTECEFEYVTDKQFTEHEAKPYEGAVTAPCEPHTPYNAPRDVSAGLTGLSPSTTYHFRLTAANANNIASDGEEPRSTRYGPPAVDSESAKHALTKAAIVEAQINPFGLDTTCQVQYVDEASFRAPGYASAVTVPCAKPDLGSAFGDQSAGATTLTGLSINTTYHYRFVAINAGGTTDGSDQTLVTFGIESFKMELLDKEGQPYTQAGGHPFEMVVSFALHTSGQSPQGRPDADGNLKDVETALPPGLVGNPTATPRCTHADLQDEKCSAAAQVGLLEIESATEKYLMPFYNIVPSTNVPAEFGARIAGYVSVYIAAGVRSGGDYGVTADSLRSSTGVSVTGVKATLWGVPADPGHDNERYCYHDVGEGNIQFAPGCESSAIAEPFLIDPTSCSAEAARLRVNTWQAPEESVSAESQFLRSRGATSWRSTRRSRFCRIRAPRTRPAASRSNCTCPRTKANPWKRWLPRIYVKPSSRCPPELPSTRRRRTGCRRARSRRSAWKTPTSRRARTRSKIGSVEIESPLLPDTLKGSVYRPNRNAIRSAR